MLREIIRIARYLAIIGCCALGFATIVATGGGGGGGGAPSTQPSITPLNDADASTATGTYRLTSFEVYFSTGEHFSSSELNSFDGQVTIDIAADWTTYKLEWHDDVYGDYYDYGENPLSYIDPSTNYDDAYYQITGPYTIVFYYENLCSDGICADVLMRIEKISDTVNSLLAQMSAGAFENDFDEGGIVTEAMRNLRF